MHRCCRGCGGSVRILPPRPRREWWRLRSVRPSAMHREKIVGFHTWSSQRCHHMGVPGVFVLMIQNDALG